ncbi:MAG: hypothetical protein EOO70_06225 [Myxococcaceae bacterium]|nr:MAG: hypothetical protein EOO70_06225 [Myxococcaceae bacterium]
MEGVILNLTGPEADIVGTALIYHILHLRDEIEDFGGEHTRENHFGQVEAAEDYEKMCADAETLLAKHWRDREEELM